MRIILQFICAVFLTIVFCLPAGSQDLEIRARVIDSTNLDPVAFSTVYIDDFSGTISDELGFFRMQVSPGKYFDTLHVSCIGYFEKEVPLRNLSFSGLDSIYLRPNIIELDAVEVHAKSRKTPRSRDIIKLSIRKIGENYPDKTILYNGYYREYIKEEDEYINLFESIINLEDPGFQTLDNFNAGLMYNRINQDFRVDSLLMRPYDNRDKLVPYSVMPIPLNNELVILRAHDPVRNFNSKSLYFIDCLETDFIRNHKFSPPKLTYLNDRPYYQITFEDNQKYTRGNDRIFAKGTIYIDALNYGIKKLNYRATVDTGIKRQKLFELSLEYKLEDKRYMLHYLSFNNLFNTRNFALKNRYIFEDKLALYFNEPVDPEFATDPKYVNVYLEDREQEIKNMKLELLNQRLLLTFSRDSELSERLKINLLPRSMETSHKIFKNEEYLAENLHFEFKGLRDLEGNEPADEEFNVYYQYREFFTNLIQQEHNGITRNLIDKTKPVIENRIYGEFSGDTSWLNTPLIKEKVGSRELYSQHAGLNRYIESLTRNNELRLNDIVYIHTDREVYSPEDTVWFKGYIRNEKYLYASELSQTFDILLVSNTGEMIKQEKYMATESGVHGQLFLEHTLDVGIYYLVGYSSWMKNFDNPALFTKKILVSKDKLDGFHLAAAFDKPEYFPGDTIQLLVNCYDDFKREVDDVSFSYRFVAGKELLQKGEGNTSRSWLDPIPLVVPAGMMQNPSIEFTSKHEWERLDTVYKVPVNHTIHMNFFPEGGQCIKGTESRMAFKGLTSKGNPVDIEGEIIDQDGKLITRTASQHNGMGRFSYRPQENRQYYFKLTRPGGLNSRFHLPEGINEGWQLHVREDIRKRDELVLDISNVRTGNDTALITLMVRGYLCYYEVVTTGRQQTVKIPLADLPKGIGVLTLFDHQLLPRTERLVYIPSEGDYRVEMGTNRKRYIPRDSIRLSIRLNSDRPVIMGGSWSLSVIDNQLCTTDVLDEPNIKSSLLLSPEIHGRIHRPDDYLDVANPDRLEDLDLLLMTQGWRNYRYLDGAGRIVQATPPENRDVISGRLMKQAFGSDPKATDGQLSVMFGGNFVKIPVDKDGTFSFLPDYSSSSNTALFLYAVDKKGKSNLSIDLESTVFEKGLSTYLEYLVDSLGREPLKSMFNKERFQDRFSLGIENHQWLEEVVITKTVIKKDLRLSDLALNKRTATADELRTAVRVEDLELRVRKPNPFGYTVWYSIDGLLQYQFDPGDGRGFWTKIPDNTYAYQILPENIEEYTIVSGPEVEALYGYGIRRVIEIRTKPFIEQKDTRLWKNPVNIGKLAVAKEFYKPVYDTEEKRKSTIPDLRKTIHWEPEVQFDENGIAEINFYNGDRYTRIKCTLEGITDDGIPVHAEHYYDVTLTREE